MSVLRQCYDCPPFPKSLSLLFPSKSFRVHGFVCFDSPAGIGIIQQALHARQDRRNIICRTPTVLEDVQAQFAVMVDVGMEHLADKPNGRGFVRVGVGEGQSQAERTVFERCIGWQGQRER